MTSLDKQSERYRTDGAEAVWLMVRCVDGAKQFEQLTVAGRCAQGRGGSRENANILCMLPDTGARYLSTSLFADVRVDMNEEDLNNQCFSLCSKRAL